MINLNALDKLTTMQTRWEDSRYARLEWERDYVKYGGLIHAVELHIPYTYWDHIKTMMQAAQAHKGQKMLIVCGDAVNLDLFSVYYKNSGDKSNPLMELHEFCEFLKIALGVYDKVVYLVANHDNRIIKAITRWMPDSGQSTALAALFGSYRSIFRSGGCEGVDIVESPFVCVGNAAFCHFEDNSKIHGAISRRIASYLPGRLQERLSMIYQAHTHAQSKIPIEGVTVVETGACCKTQDYWRRGSMLGAGKRVTVGYGECFMRDGWADDNKGGYVKLGWEDPL